MEMSQLDVTTRIVNAFYDHVWLLAGLAVVARWGLPWAIKEGFKREGPDMVVKAMGSEEGQKKLHASMTAYFNNGGGEKMRDIVRNENAMQTELHKQETTRIVEAQIRRHEEVEGTRFQGALDKALDTFEDEITDRYELTPRRTRRGKRR